MIPSSWPITSANLPLLIQFSTACRLNVLSYLRRGCTGVSFIGFDGSLFPDSTVRQFETAPLDGFQVNTQLRILIGHLTNTQNCSKLILL